MDKTVKYSAAETYQTKDGSLIRELMHPDQHGNRNQSLAEAEVGPGVTTLLHCHHQSEELYHITAGQGLMTLANDQFDVVTGDTVHIAPGVAHCIRSIGTNPLKILCCSSPPYSHEDTELLESPSSSLS
ncbi:hypothetical protein BOW53_14325 [Solemya pervernicosa gill symbiont]|uniref:Cupin type-2 domain-containing protein n=2 Tax=Gammaproteobacteria incertae sedis TaxID=118884 RepID=A0A1T2L0Z6_9GAMM|nr:cupin domain-containing protein [Candidatus Reidiella endopervernicosa]OOZ38769.1 hypothetical protein BOW53_14325 [Solemya pervernicosa gill symbiont]QKQ26361.1 cupin domain-containing protein [Candidatus Reidiella endopervernicosa]